MYSIWYKLIMLQKRTSHSLKYITKQRWNKQKNSIHDRMKSIGVSWNNVHSVKKSTSQKVLFSIIEYLVVNLLDHGQGQCIEGEGHRISEALVLRVCGTDLKVHDKTIYKPSYKPINKIVPTIFTLIYKQRRKRASKHPLLCKLVYMSIKNTRMFLHYVNQFKLNNKIKHTKLKVSIKHTKNIYSILIVSLNILQNIYHLFFCFKTGLKVICNS